MPPSRSLTRERVLAMALALLAVPAGARIRVQETEGTDECWPEAVPVAVVAVAPSSEADGGATHRRRRLGLRMNRP